MVSNFSSKRYEPSLIDLANQNSSHTILIELTGCDKQVLEIGTSTGYISKILKEHGNRVTGIEIDPEAGSLAEQYCDRMIIADVESLDFDKAFNGQVFDVILLGDVLEHLKNPGCILETVQKFLKSDGYLVVSLPNFCHGDVFLNLLNDDFHYTPMGLLDETHLRFFGIRNILSLFARSGYQVSDLHTTKIDIGKTEIGRDIENIPHDILIFFQSLPFSNVYQYIFIGRPCTNPVSPAIKETDLSKLLDKTQSRLLEDFGRIQHQLKEKSENFDKLSKYTINLEKFIADQEKRIADQTEYVRKVEATVVDQEKQIADQKTYIRKVEDSIIDREKQIADQKTYIRKVEDSIIDREKQISEQKVNGHTIQNSSREWNSDIAANEQTIYDLKSDISEKARQIAEQNQSIQVLKTNISAYDSRIQEFRQQTLDNNRKIAERDSHISEVASYVCRLEQEIAAKNRHIIDLTNQFLALKSDHDSIVRSITYQMTQKFHLRIVERLLPRNSKRRKVYDNSLKAGRCLVNRGWRTDLWNDRKTEEKNKNPENEVSVVCGGINPSGTIVEKNELDEGLHRFLAKKGSRLAFPVYKEPVASIIILTYNKSSYSYQCLQSILKFSTVPYELILVDNGSTDNTSELLERIDNAVLIKSKNNLGFIKGCNEGATKASGKYLVFLNNDTVVTDNWLSGLISTIANDPKCGSVGCKLVWPNGKLQEAGSIVWSDGSALGYGRGDDPLKPEYSYVKEVDYCSAACLLVRKDLFNILNGFDERYIPAYYEDTDLCIGIQALGYKILYQPEVTIYHHEFTSSSKEHAEKAMITNQKKLVEKWRDFLITKEEPDLARILKARDTRKAKTILFIDDRVPASCQGSGYPRSNMMLKFLGELGYKVTFFPLADLTPWQPYTSEFQQMGIEVFFGNNTDFQSFARQRSNFYDVVIVSRPHNFEKTYEIIKQNFPKAYLIYDAEALFSTREILKAELEGICLSENQKKTMRTEELKLVKMADTIITVSDNERKIIQQHCDVKNITIFSHPVRVQKTTNAFHSRKDVLFVGSFLALNGPNDDAILYFVEKIWPGVQKQLDCKLFIVGINPPGRIQDLCSDTIIVTGFVPDLEEYYNNCRVFIVPHRYAAGIPLKLIEAMSYGIPAVASDLIASQLNIEDGKEILVAGDPSEFAEKIINLYRNERIWNQINKNSIEYIADTFDPQKGKADLHAMIENATT
jgi:GT2 family glycosyltransferase/2-polyprenyl-3-methyl-5-hydroxy-6-metoxy-1,4-benzoquinol methylase